MDAFNEWRKKRLIDTPQQLKPLLNGSGLTGTISAQLPPAGLGRLNELMDS